MNRARRYITLAAIAAVGTIWSAQGLPRVMAAPDADQLRATELTQSEIRAQTAKVVSELDRLISEFDRNGLSSVDDAQALKKIRAVLSNLSDKQMAHVVELLQQARAASDAGGQQRTAVDAFGTQKTIVTQLRQILIDFQRQQELENLSIRFRELAVRQNKNLKLAVRLARETGGAALDTYNSDQKGRLQMQQSEEKSLQDEIDALLSKLGVAIEGADQDTLARVQTAMGQVGQEKVRASLEGTVVDLSHGDMFHAGTDEKQVRDQLRDLSRLVAPPRDTAAILKQAIIEVELSIIDQKKLIDNTKGTGADINAYIDFESRQSDLVDNTDGTQKDIEHVAPVASDYLKQAEDQMQEARSAFLQVHKDEATAGEAGAVARLEDAHKDLLAQLAKAEEEKPKQDNLTDAQDLKAKIHALRVREEALIDQTQANKDAGALGDLAKTQSPMAGEARDLQPAAAEVCVPAADKLAEAATEMDYATSALKDKLDGVKGAVAEKSADDALAAAEKALDQEIAKLEQDKKDLADLQQAKDKVDKLMKDEQKLELNTAKEAAKPDKTPDAEKDLDKTQKDLTKQTDDVKTQLPDDAKDAQAPLDDAKKDMQAADDKLQPDPSKSDPSQSDPSQPQANKPDASKPDPAAAEKNEQKAVADLSKASQALDKQIADKQKDLGEQPDPSQDPADAQKNLDDAQKDTQQAQNDLQPPDGSKPDAAKTPDAGQKLEAALDKVDQAMTAAPPEAQQPLQDAANALADAAAKAEAGQPDAAQPDAAQAQQAMAQAQAAMAMAEAGMPEQGPPGQEPGHEPGTEPGKEPGDDPGKSPEAEDGPVKDTKSSGDTDKLAHKTGALNGPRAGAAGASALMNLPPREREKILQGEKEKYPEAYGPMIEQYYKNLSDDQSK